MKLVGVEDIYELFLLTLSTIPCQLLPARAKRYIAACIGDIVWLARSEDRRLITNRLSEAMLDTLTLDQSRDAAREVFRNRWQEEFSFPSMYGRNGRQNVRIVGMENLHEGLSRGKGLILWDSPFGRRLFAKAILHHRGFDLLQVHEAVHGGSLSWLGQTVIRRIYRRAEAEVVKVIDIEDESFAYLRTLVNQLRQNRVLCISAFGGKGHKFVSARFLRTTFQFATGTHSLAKMTGAPILPLFCFEESDGSTRLVIEKPMSLQPGRNGQDPVVQWVSEYADLVESHIRRYPGQWHRWHRIPPRGSEWATSPIASHAR